jgi:hypothetical protein
MAVYRALIDVDRSIRKSHSAAAIMTRSLLSVCLTADSVLARRDSGRRDIRRAELSLARLFGASLQASHAGDDAVPRLWRQTVPLCLVRRVNQHQCSNLLRIQRLV